MAGELLIDEPLDGVRRLTISNPAKRNALDHPILDGIAEAVRAASVDGTRCLILTGADGMFSSGYDIGDIPEDVFAAEAEKLVAHPFTSAIDALDATDVPTVAALPGHTIGGGLELALACDLRIAARNASLGLPEARLGLIPGAGGTQRLTSLCGRGTAARLILGAEIVDGANAAALGIVQWAEEAEVLRQRCAEIAASISRLSPAALAASKACIAAAGDTERDGYSEELDATKALFANADTRARVTAFLAARGK
jgi:enoyl-CoA hydratase/carnithine racemase